MVEPAAAEWLEVHTLSKGLVAVRLALVAASLAALTPSRGAALAPPPRVIRGVVRSDRGDPIRAAELTTDVPGERGESAADGGFRLETLATGPTITLHVRAVGFSPRAQVIDFAGADSATVAITLTAVAQKLPTVEVRADSVAYTSAKMRAFEERRREGIGRFLTREILAQRENAPLSDVLRMTPGLSFVRRPDRCGGGIALASSRGGAFSRQQWMACEGQPPFPFPLACYVAIYLDGVRIWYPGLKEPPDIDAITSVAGLEAAEIYRGASETPSEFQTTGSACGVVLLWTRTGEKG